MTLAVLYYFLQPVSQPESAICATTNDMFYVMKKYEETPFFLGQAKYKDQTNGKISEILIMLTVNTSNGHWSQFQIFSDGTACIAGSGYNANYVENLSDKPAL